MRQLIFTFCILNFAFPDAHAQYAPQAGLAGSDAIAATSSRFIGWANACHIQRGLQQIGDINSGYAQAGDSAMATGIADGNIVSLGDSGVATLTFPSPLINGPGADFAVFENGFRNPADSEGAFLELAFVEVSSDGAHFFRFPAVSLTQDTAQLSSLVGQNYMNARLIHNLAGKYVSGYGTPFDLAELEGIAGLNVNRIIAVRIVDVIGDIGTHACRDSAGHKINDPFPTAFPTGGFDLDGVGMINAIIPSGVIAMNRLDVRIYPNPVSDKLQVHVPAMASLQLSDATGRIVRTQTIQADGELSLGALSAGIYYLTAQDEQGNRWAGKVSRQ